MQRFSIKLTMNTEFNTPRCHHRAQNAMGPPLGSDFEVSEGKAPRLEEPSKSPVGAEGQVLPAVVILLRTGLKRRLRAADASHAPYRRISRSFLGRNDESDHRTRILLAPKQSMKCGRRYVLNLSPVLVDRDRRSIFSPLTRGQPGDTIPRVSRSVDRSFQARGTRRRE